MANPNPQENLPSSNVLREGLEKGVQVLQNLTFGELPKFPEFHIDISELNKQLNPETFSHESAIITLKSFVDKAHDSVSQKAEGYRQGIDQNDPRYKQESMKILSWETQSLSALYDIRDSFTKAFDQLKNELQVKREALAKPIAEKILHPVDAIKSAASTVTDAAKNYVQKAKEYDRLQWLTGAKIVDAVKQGADAITDKNEKFQKEYEQKTQNGIALIDEIRAQAGLKSDAGIQEIFSKFPALADAQENFLKAEDFFGKESAQPSYDVESMDAQLSFLENLSSRVSAEVQREHEQQKSTEKVGTRYMENGVADFGGDKKAEKETTLGDMFPEAKALKVNDKLAVKRGKEFYYENGKRALVFTGTKVEETQPAAEELAEFEKKRSKKNPTRGHEKASAPSEPVAGAPAPDLPPQNLQETTTEAPDAADYNRKTDQILQKASDIVSPNGKALDKKQILSAVGAPGDPQLKTAIEFFYSEKNIPSSTVEEARNKNNMAQYYFNILKKSYPQ